MNVSQWATHVRSLISRAVLAPSSHNSQPWYFRMTGPNIDFYADRTRAIPVNDPQDRELAISCGCALFNLRVAAARARMGLQIQLLPDRGEPDWLARVALCRLSQESTEHLPLAKYLEHRHTYRKRFADREVPADVVAQLIDAAAGEGGTFHPLVSEQDRQQAADMIAEGDALQWGNPSWRRELAAWMHPRRQGDGLLAPPLPTPVAQLIIRTFDMGGGVGAKDRELAEASPLLAVMGSVGDQPSDWLQVGQALQRVLLTACQHGLQASFLNQPIQVASIRPRLQALVGDTTPQLLLRLGYPVGDVSPAPRRPLEAVIE